MIANVSDQTLTHGKFKYSLFPEIKLETTYIDGKRFYTTPEGNLYRSVTTALSQINADKIRLWREKVGEEQANKISTASSTRGTKFHKLCEDYILGKELKSDIQSRLMFDPVKNYLDQYVDVIYGVETGLYSDKLRLAGRCDLVARLHGLPCIIDFKTSTKPKKEEWIKNYFFQTTAYAQMVAERYNLLCKWVCILIASQEGDLQVFYRPVKLYYKELVDFIEKNPG